MADENKTLFGKTGVEIKVSVDASNAKRQMKGFTDEVRKQWTNAFASKKTFSQIGRELKTEIDRIQKQYDANKAGLRSNKFIDQFFGTRAALQKEVSERKKLIEKLQLQLAKVPMNKRITSRQSEEKQAHYRALNEALQARRTSLREQIAEATNAYGEANLKLGKYNTDNPAKRIHDTLRARYTNLTEYGKLYSQLSEEEKKAVDETYRLIEAQKQLRRELGEVRQKVIDTNQEKLNADYAKNLEELRKRTASLRKEQEKSTKVSNSYNKSLKSGNTFTLKFAGGLKNLVSMLKRIVVYRFLRGMLTNFLNSLKEGVQNLYQYSKAMKLAFADTMDKYATKTLTLKNALGSFAGQLMSIFMPVIVKSAQALTHLFNEMARIVAILRGESFYSKAIDYQQEWNKSMEEGKKLIAGFDELNIWSSNKNDEQDFSKMFEETAVGTSKVADFIQNIINKVTELSGKIQTNISQVQEWLKPIKQTIKSVWDTVNTIINNTIKSPEFQQFLAKVEEVARKVWTFIGNTIEALTPYVNYFLDTVLPPIWELLTEIFGIIGDIVDTVVEALGGWEAVGYAIKIIALVLRLCIQYVTELVKQIRMDLKPVLEWVGGQIKSVLGIFKNIFDIVDDLINHDYSKLFNDLASFAKNLTKVITAPVDALLQLIGLALNSMTDKVNALIGMLNKIPGVNLPQIKINTSNWSIGNAINKGIDSFVDKVGGGRVPQTVTPMAQGAIVSAPTYALIGENPQTTPEIVTPQTLLKETIDSSNGVVVDTLITVSRQIIDAINSNELSVQIGDETIARSASRGATKLAKMQGVPVL